MEQMGKNLVCSFHKLGGVANFVAVRGSAAGLASMAAVEVAVEAYFEEYSAVEKMKVGG